MSRFDDLVSDLSGQLDAALAAELAAEVEDRTRRERAKVPLALRLRAAIGSHVVVDTVAGDASGTVEAGGADWVVLRAGARRTLLPLAGVVAVRGLPAAAATASPLVAERLDLGFALRRLARDRAVVAAVTVDGCTRSGRVDFVGADHLELVELEAARRTAVAFAALVALRWE